MNKRVALKPSDYVHLHNHTQYSLLDGLTKIPDLMAQVQNLGMDAVSVTDHGTMSGVIEFYNAATAAKVKPIIGMEAYVAARAYTDKDPSKDRQYYHLTMIAMNNTGYQNLMRLSTLANLNGFYYRPRIDRELLEKYNEGLIILSGCIGGEVSDALRQGQYESAKQIAYWYKEIFGDRYYIELQDHGHPKHKTAWKEQKKVNEQLLKLAGQLKVPAVVTCDAHYLMHEDQEAHEILLCVQTGSFLNDENRFSLKDFHLHVEDPREIIKRWGDEYPELITNTKKIANRCDVNIELGKILIPKYPLQRGQTEKSLLEKLAWQGLAWRYGDKSRESASKMTISEAEKIVPLNVKERAAYELEIISRMGFNGYFLIVSDFINWGKDKGIVFGPGRGSAASSILAYALRITEIDPMKYDLLFERFLNPDRISMPDIDIDIQDSRRDEVINYCVEKYGKEQVANIVTFGRMAARNSVRDVARVLQVPYAEADRLAKMIPPPVQGRHIPLAKSLKEVTELKEENKNTQSARVFDLAMRLEGTIRSHGVHAAGVVIAPDEIVKFTPLELAQKGVIATQYSMGPVEDLGLLKIDFLGLSNLTIIKNTLRIIKRVESKEINISEITLKDKKTYDLLQKGDTTGVFQLESAGMKRYLKQLKPSVFEDIIAMVALYRPGPMQFIDEFIARKHGRRKIEYLHPKMEPALKNTYGVLVYQEQFMQISKDMCGFSGGQADTLRKAAGKKQRETMAKMKKEFVAGMIKHSSTSKEIAGKIWAQIETFADYGFNKVHSACYGLIAYQTAYLKANYPVAYMAALMTSDYDNIDRLAVEMAECKKMGIKVLPPDINESFHEFAVVPGEKNIRFGLDAIKNVGHGAVEEILRARKKAGGSFVSVESFCKFVNLHIVNRKAMECLIKTGALDSFGDRSYLLNNLDNIISFSLRLQKDTRSGQVELFGGTSNESNLKPQIAWSNDETSSVSNEHLIWERELLGLYLSQHPLDSYAEYLSKFTTALSSLNNIREGENIIVGGFISSVREITTKNGAKMAFIKLADHSNEVELIVFPKLYQKNPDFWQRDKIIIATGKLSSGRVNKAGGDELKLLVDEAIIADLEKPPFFSKLDSEKNSYEYPQKSAVSAKQRLYIRLEDSKNQPLLMSLKEKLDIHKGDTEVVLVTGPTEEKQIIKLPQNVTVNEESIRELASIFGALNVIVR